MSVALAFDTKMFSHSQPGGMFSVKDAAECPGNVFWVGSNITGATDGAGYGRNPGTPFATLVYAETQCLTQRCDTIYVMQNHTETWTHSTGAAILTLDVANLQIIGLGRSTRPIFLIDGHANNYISITGADTTIKNCQFESGAADVAKAVLVAAAGVRFDGCHFLDSTAGENFLFSIMTTAAADEMEVEKCTFISIDASVDAFIHLVGACNGVRILHNYMNGPCVTSLIEAITNPCLDIHICHNHLRSLTEGNDLAGLVDLVASSTGIIHDNLCYNADDTDILTGIDGASCSLARNISSNEDAQEAVMAGGPAA